MESSPQPPTPNTCPFPRLVFRKTSTPAPAVSTESQSPQHLLFGTPVAPRPQIPMKTILQDLKYAFRGLIKNPGFTVMAIFTVALGVGANTAIFSVVKAVLLNQLPYLQPNRLVMLAETGPDSIRPVTVDFTTTYDLRARSHSFERMSLFRTWSSALVEQDTPELINGLRVNYDFFDTLGVKMLRGRTFRSDHDT